MNEKPLTHAALVEFIQKMDQLQERHREWATEWAKKAAADFAKALEARAEQRGCSIAPEVLPPIQESFEAQLLSMALQLEWIMLGSSAFPKPKSLLHWTGFEP